MEQIVRRAMNRKVTYNPKFQSFMVIFENSRKHNRKVDCRLLLWVSLRRRFGLWEGWHYVFARQFVSSKFRNTFIENFTATRIGGMWKMQRAWPDIFLAILLHSIGHPNRIHVKIIINVFIYPSSNSFAGFAGRIPRSVAERLVADRHLPAGTYLVREREFDQLEYALTIRDMDQGHGGPCVKHYKIKRMDNEAGFFITTRMIFPTLEALVTYYSGTF